MAQSNFGFHHELEDTTARQWLDRCVGRWTSRRRYIFNMRTMEPQNFVTNFEIKAANDGWVVSWTGETEGEMELFLSEDGKTLSRSRDYFGKGSHDARIEVIDEDCIVLHTTYGGVRYREEIRFLGNDTHRLRQTIGYDEVTGAVRLLGQYAEFRI